MSSLNQFDLAFVVDTTGSMGSFIGEAKRKMLGVIKELISNYGVDLSIGIVEYRDHEPQDNVLTLVYPTTKDMNEVQKTIKNISLGGGGDVPEAVLDGIQESIDVLKWRRHSRRVIILIGDSPPHGYSAAHDAWPDGCPCGKTICSVSQSLEDKNIVLYSLGLTDDVKMSFSQISSLSGGSYFSPSDGEVMAATKTLLDKEFQNIEFDEKILLLLKKGYNKDEIIEKLEISLGDTLNSIGRLRSRDLV